MRLIPKIKTNNSTFLSKTKCEDGHSWWVSFEFYPFAVEQTTTVFEGRMYNEHGYWSQSKAAVKTLNGEIGSDGNLRGVVAGSEKARLLAQGFRNEYPNTKKLNFVMPCLAEMDSVSVFNTPFRYIKGYEKQLAGHECVLIEEYIEGDFCAFIGRNGERCKTVELFDTFVHYSYVESNGDLVVCNLEGVERNKDFKLSSVTIHSRSQSYGTRDEGEQGILNVFKNHKCNDTCKNWPTPAFGLVPTAPSLPECKIDSFDTSMTVPPVYEDKEYLIKPPPYDIPSQPQLKQTHDRALVHGQ